MGKKLDRESFIRSVKERGNASDVEIVGEFNGVNNKILIKCKVCGKESFIKATKLYYRNCCPNCYCKNGTSKIEKMNKDFLLKLNNAGKFELCGILNKAGSIVKFRCKKCGTIFETNRYKALKWRHCPNCLEEEKHLRYGFCTAMFYTDKDMCEYLLNKEDAEKYPRSSAEKIEWKCPSCGNIFKKEPCKIFERGFSCPRCSTKYSFPNRVVYSFLKECNIDFDNEHIFEWSKSKNNKYIYDFYIPSKNMIIEAMGNQHYEKGIMKETLESIQERDNKKELLAYKNGIENYVKLDCSASSFEFIKNSIINNSILASKFNLDDIIWNTVFVKSCDTFVRDVCDFIKKNPTATTTDIYKHFNVGAKKVTTAIGIGVDCGIIDKNVFNDLDTNWKNKMRKNCNDKRLIGIKECSAYYNNHPDMRLIDMSENNNISNSCFIKYIQEGTKLGLCEYSKEKSIKNSSKYKGANKRKPVIQFDLYGNFIQNFDSVISAAKHLNCKPEYISASAKGKISSYFNYIWKYKEGE